MSIREITGPAMRDPGKISVKLNEVIKELNRLSALPPKQRPEQPPQEGLPDSD